MPGLGLLQCNCMTALVDVIFMCMPIFAARVIDCVCMCYIRGKICSACLDKTLHVYIVPGVVLSYADS